MRVETKYIANDGKVFDNEFDCCKYEINLLIKSNNVIMLNKDFENTDEISECYYCIIKTTEDLEIFKELSDYEGLRCPKNVGAFYYDAECDVWLDLYDRVKNLKEELHNSEKILSM